MYAEVRFGISGKYIKQQHKIKSWARESTWEPPHYQLLITYQQFERLHRIKMWWRKRNNNFKRYLGHNKFYFNRTITTVRKILRFWPCLPLSCRSFAFKTISWCWMLHIVGSVCFKLHLKVNQYQNWNSIDQIRELSTLFQAIPRVLFELE